MPDQKSSDRGWVSREEYDRMEQLHKNNLWAYVHAYARACDFIGRNFGDEAWRHQSLSSRGLTPIRADAIPI